MWISESWTLSVSEANNMEEESWLRLIKKSQIKLHNQRTKVLHQNITIRELSSTIDPNKISKLSIYTQNCCNSQERDRTTALTISVGACSVRLCRPPHVRCEPDTIMCFTGKYVHKEASDWQPSFMATLCMFSIYGVIWGLNFYPHLK